jgi:hypothetical protein
MYTIADSYRDEGCVEGQLEKLKESEKVVS